MRPHMLSWMMASAHLHALAQLVDKCKDDQHKRDLEWEIEIVRGLYAPVTVGESTLSRYVGQYGRRSFAMEEGTLTYMHQDHPVAWKLVPMTETRFRLDNDIKFEFVLDEGAASAVVISYRDDRPEIRIEKAKE